MTVGLRADTWSKRRTRACAACTSMGREFVGERLGGVPHGRKVTVQQGQATRRIHGWRVVKKDACPELFCSTQSSALNAVPWLHNAIHFCRQRSKGARERLPDAACKVGHQRAHVRPVRHWLAPARIALTDAVSGHGVLLSFCCNGMEKW